MLNIVPTVCILTLFSRNLIQLIILKIEYFSNFRSYLLSRYATLIYFHLLFFCWLHFCCLLLI